MTQQKRIFIIGNPGAGKALFGKTLAEKLGWQFINTDLELEFRIGRIITEIVGKEGSDNLFDCLVKIFHSQLSKENIVVNTDASIVLNKKIIEQLSSEFVVYLQVSTGVQLNRTPRNPDPLLSTNISEFLDQLHQERDNLYEKLATVSINTDDNDLDGHVNFILKQFMKNNDVNKLKLNKHDMVIFHKTLHTPVNLTDQQARCLKLLAQGMSSKEIANELNISFRTVEGSITKMIDLLGCKSSKELIFLYHDKP